jgi:adenylate cyclase
VRKRFITLLLPLIAILSVPVLYYMQISIPESFEARTYDLRFKVMRGPLEPDPKIAIVAIDEKSIDELGRWPWSRRRFAELVDYASEAGANSIILDVIFPEPSSPEADREFAEALKRSGRSTLAMSFFFKDGAINDMLQNIPELQDAAKSVGHINILPDSDGVVRWTPLVFSYNGKLYNSLALEAVMSTLGVDELEVDDYEITVGPIRIQTDISKRMQINYIGPPGTYKMFSFADVINGRVGKEELKGKTLLVGATAVGIYDMRVTPFSSNSSGVEVNANITDNILRGNFIRKGGIEALIDLVCIVTLDIFAFLIMMRVRTALAIPLIFPLIAGHTLFANYMFLKGHWISIVYPVLSIALGSLAGAYIRFFVIESKAKEIRNMFSSYVSKAVVDELVKHPERAKVGGESKVLTIMFSDVKNYTGFSETRTPREVVDILNEYLAVMTELIFKYNGTLDKYMGDGILAFWGAPIDQENHAELAVRCALEMFEKLKGLQEGWKARGMESLDCGIGMNTGEVIVGNIGVAGKKVEYTAIGDNVNLTYRIQNLHRDMNLPIISESLHEKIKHVADTKFMGSENVKGKKEPLKVYVVTGMKHS